jgi:hypothetical protein
VRALAPYFIAASAAIVMLLGLLHLLYTFHGPKLLPRDRDLKTRMQEVSPVISRETTMWKAWVGFNASHSCAAILFGAVYGYLSLVHSAFLFRSAFLLSLGLLFLASEAARGARPRRCGAAPAHSARALRASPGAGACGRRPPAGSDRGVHPTRTLDRLAIPA